MTEHVVVIHGLAETKWWMAVIARGLKKAGYVVHNLGYPSTKFPIEDLVESHLRPLIKKLPDDATAVHFVTHSMGSILLRAYRAKYDLAVNGRTVMIGPPNQGSEVAEMLKNWRLFKFFFGPAAQQLVTDDAMNLPKRLGAVDFECGVIAGRKGYMHLYFGQVLPKPNDGLVTVQSTKIKGMADHIVLNVDHSFMVMSSKVIRQTIAFLKTGKFNPA